MALIKCLDCGRDISERAAHCVGCGAPCEPSSSDAADEPQDIVELSRQALSQPSQMALVIAALVVVALAWWAPYDSTAEKTVDTGFKRAIATYAAARALNGVISLAQGTELTMGVGVSTTLSVGEVLDPINDAVEQFSDLMLLATISFGMQMMLANIGSHPYVNLALTVAIVAALGLSITRRGVPDIVRGLVVVLLLARFAVPLSSAASEMVYVAFLSQSYEESSKAIGASTERLGELQSQVNEESIDTAETAPPPVQEEQQEQEEPGMFGRIMNSAKKLATKLDPAPAFKSLRSKMADLKRGAEEIAENLTRLAVIFVLQTLVLPLLFLWGFYYLVRSAVGPRGAKNLSPPSRWPEQLGELIRRDR